MAIINRDLDPSLQVVNSSVLVSTSVGASAALGFQIAQLAAPGTLKGVAVAASSISGAPVVSLSVKRWTATGVTTILYVGSTLAVLAYGASAAQQMVPLAAAGSTLLNLQAGDVLVLTQEFSGGNVAIGGAIVTSCVQALQDITQHFNITL